MTVQSPRRRWAVGTFVAWASLTALGAHASEAERVLADLASIQPGQGIHSVRRTRIGPGAK